MGYSRVADGSLVVASGVQVGLADLPNLMWQDILENPIQAILGIVTIFLIVARTIRMAQKISQHNREKRELV